MSTLGQLYRGETRFDLIGRRRSWYIASGVVVFICLLSMVFRGFTFGIEFSGGNEFLVDTRSGTTVEQVRHAIEARGVPVSSAQVRGQGADNKYVIRTGRITDEQSEAAKAAIREVVQVDLVNTTSVSSSWGRAITDKALLGLVVFLFLVGGFIWVRFEKQMALAALAALAHDLLLTAGVYSLVGFEVTPGTVIGLLTILGYSLYDTVVVFDKVEENTRGLLGSHRYTYAEAANQAVNQTLMRSINTSLIGLLPVAGLLFVGAGLLGVGTLKDLALVLFIGLLTGAYSSLFLATPWLVDLKLLDPRYKQHTQRVLAKRAAAEQARVAVGTAGSRIGGKAAAPTSGGGDADEVVQDDSQESPNRADALAASSTPRVGAKPAQRRRPGGGARPGGKRR